MTIQTINIGGYANDGTGDDLRTAFAKVNENFALLDTEIGIANGVNLGTGVGIFASKDVTSLNFKSLTSTDHTVDITSTANTVNLAAKSKLESDTSPKLGANLNLDGYAVEGGDVQTTVHGLDMRMVNSLLAIAITTNQLSVDLGTIVYPTGSNGVIHGPSYLVDFGTFTLYRPSNKYDFGTIV